MTEVQGVVGVGPDRLGLSRILARARHFAQAPCHRLRRRLDRRRSGASRQRQAAFLARGHQARPAADAARPREARRAGHRRLVRLRRRRCRRRLDARHRAGDRQGGRPQVQDGAGAQRAGQGLSQAPLSRRPHHAAQPRAADQRGDHRQERAHRRHDGARADRGRDRAGRAGRAGRPRLGHRAVLDRSR